jgi:hypothetical protein
MPCAPQHHQSTTENRQTQHRQSAVSHPVHLPHNTGHRGVSTARWGLVWFGDVVYTLSCPRTQHMPAAADSACCPQQSPARGTPPQCHHKRNPALSSYSARAVSCDGPAQAAPLATTCCTVRHQLLLVLSLQLLLHVSAACVPSCEPSVQPHPLPPSAAIVCCCWQCWCCCCFSEVLLTVSPFRRCGSTRLGYCSCLSSSFCSQNHTTRPQQQARYPCAEGRHVWKVL